MITEILGKKIGMTQVFTENGDRIPVTVIEAGPCPFIQRKTKEHDGYDAVQIGYGEKKAKNVNKPLAAHLKKYEAGNASVIQEVRVKEGELSDKDKEVTVEVFNAGDRLDISGVSKGRGFAGVMKRYNMKGAPASRGSHENFRHVGSLAGGSSNVTRVWPGKRLPGRMGGVKRTILGLELIRVIKETNHIIVKGAVPGANGGLIRIRKTNRG